MCEGGLTYADVYNGIYAASDKAAWMAQHLRRIERLCLAHQERALAKLNILLTTQSCLGHERFAAVHAAIGQASSNAGRVRQHRTRRLVRRALHHIYRPGGAMMHKLRQDCPFMHSS